MAEPKQQERPQLESKSMTVIGVLNAVPAQIPWLSAYPSSSFTFDPKALNVTQEPAEIEAEEPMMDWGFGTHIREAISAIKELRKK
jgi:hypothetical protein